MNLAAIDYLGFKIFIYLQDLSKESYSSIFNFFCFGMAIKGEASKGQPHRSYNAGHRLLLAFRLQTIFRLFLPVSDSFSLF